MSSVSFPIAFVPEEVAPTAPARSGVVVVASVAGLLRRGTLGLGPRRPPRARRLKELEDAAVPVESRIVWRAGAVAFR